MAYIRIKQLITNLNCLHLSITSHNFIVEVCRFDLSKIKLFKPFFSAGLAFLANVWLQLLYSASAGLDRHGDHPKASERLEVSALKEPIGQRNSFSWDTVERMMENDGMEWTTKLFHFQTCLRATQITQRERPFCFLTRCHMSYLCSVGRHFCRVALCHSLPVSGSSLLQNFVRPSLGWATPRHRYHDQLGDVQPLS